MRSARGSEGDVWAELVWRQTEHGGHNFGDLLRVASLAELAHEWQEKAYLMGGVEVRGLGGGALWG